MSLDKVLVGCVVYVQCYDLVVDVCDVLYRSVSQPELQKNLYTSSWFSDHTFYLEICKKKSV